MQSLSNLIPRLAAKRFFHKKPASPAPAALSIHTTSASPYPSEAPTPQLKMKSVVTPVSFSGVSVNAARFAANFAKRMPSQDTDFSLLHCIDIAFDVVASTGNDMSKVREFEESRVSNASAELDKVKEELNYDGETRTLITHGPPIMSICEFVEHENTDLIVMGTIGAEGFKESLVGSNTSRVVQNATSNILVVPPNTDPDHEVKDMVFALESFEPEHMERLAVAIDVARMYDAHLYALHIDAHKKRHVAFGEAYYGVPQSTKQLSDTTAELSVRADYDKFDFVNLSKYEGKSERVLENALDAFVADKDIDMISMYSRDHGLAKAIMHKSFTKKLSMHTNVPLLILK